MSCEKLAGKAGRSGTSFSTSPSTTDGFLGLSESTGYEPRGRLRLRPSRLDCFSPFAVVGRLSSSSPVDPGRRFPKRVPADVLGLPLSSHGVSVWGEISFTRGPVMFDQNDTRPIVNFLLPQFFVFQPNIPPNPANADVVSADFVNIALKL